MCKLLMLIETYFMQQNSKKRDKTYQWPLISLRVRHCQVIHTLYTFSRSPPFPFNALSFRVEKRQKLWRRIRFDRLDFRSSFGVDDRFQHLPPKTESECADAIDGETEADASSGVLETRRYFLRLRRCLDRLDGSLSYRWDHLNQWDVSLAASRGF